MWAAEGGESSRSYRSSVHISHHAAPPYNYTAGGEGLKERQAEEGGEGKKGRLTQSK